MLCFEFAGHPSVKVILCEETIRYSAFRGDGVRIGANVIVQWEPSADPYLYAIHRRALDSIRVATRETWTGEEDGYPYSYIFSRLSANRVVHGGDDSFLVKQPGSDAPGRAVCVLPQRIGGQFSAVDMMSQSTSAAEDAPFTAVRLGPFPDAAAAYLFRFEFQVSGSSYVDLIPEHVDTATRLYRVYGAEHIRRDIEIVDIPRAAQRQEPARHQRYVELFESFGPERRLVPAAYSIVAVDNPNCNPAKLRCVDLTSDLRNISEQLDPRVYEHEALKNITGRLHWFVSDRPSQGFHLQLMGPMALDDIQQLTSTDSAA